MLIFVSTCITGCCKNSDGYPCKRKPYLLSFYHLHSIHLETNTMGPCPKFWCQNRDQHYGFRSKILSSVQCPLDSGQGLDKLPVLIYHLFFTYQCTICLCASLCSTERKAGCILYCYFISLWFFFIKLKKQRRISCILKHEQFIQHPHISNKNKQLLIIHSNRSWRFYIVVFRKPRHAVYTCTSIIYTPQVLYWQLSLFRFTLSINVHNSKIQHTSSIHFHSLLFGIIAYHFDRTFIKVGVQLS